MIRFKLDGILSIKEETDLEHEEDVARTDFWVGDSVFAMWDDGERYLAEILASGCKLITV